MEVTEINDTQNEKKKWSEKLFNIHGNIGESALRSHCPKGEEIPSHFLIFLTRKRVFFPGHNLWTLTFSDGPIITDARPGEERRKNPLLTRTLKNKERASRGSFGQKKTNKVSCHPARCNTRGSGLSNQRVWHFPGFRCSPLDSRMKKMEEIEANNAKKKQTMRKIVVINFSFLYKSLKSILSV